MAKSKWIKFNTIYNQIKIGLRLVRWLWLVPGNRYLQYDVVRNVGVLDEDG